jgi:hypothetical protein
LEVWGKRTGTAIVEDIRGQEGERKGATTEKVGREVEVPDFALKPQEWMHAKCNISCMGRSWMGSEWAG